MDYDRFVLLNKFLHFADNTKAGDDDTIPRKLYKLWPILQHMKRRFPDVYQPERDVAIDESLMLWKGSLGWEQYIPSKRARFGIKSFEICKSSSAFILDFFVYTGVGTVYDPGLDEDLPMGSKVILTLGRQFFNKGYYINMENFFSSPGLYDELCARSTDAVGTIRPNHKGLPKDFLKQKLRKGEIKAAYSEKLMLLKWRDKKDVHMLSTIHDARTRQVARADPNKPPVMKPQVCCDYNDTMGDVDLSDAFFSAYPSSRKRLKKYYIKQFRHILDMAVLNAHILFKKMGGTSPRLSFILSLVDRLVGKYKVQQREKRAGRPSHSDTPLRLTERHFLTRIPPTPKEEYPQRKCHVCLSKGTRRDTRYMGNKCDKALCITPCFEIYLTSLSCAELCRTDIVPPIPLDHVSHPPVKFIAQRDVEESSMYTLLSQKGDKL
ncbi:piggyBac transposable element-derived protein 4-like [Lineus longissimus]|uniref:piggyBac transposable element-derived protein 4-like n=1 Tax=Lineus longissimus TaxID=88925 RepID=UPI00315D6499